MDIFQYIIELVIKKEHACDIEDDTINHPKMFALYPMYFFTGHNTTPVTKYEALKCNILENKYLADEQKEMFFDIFSRAQKIYFSISRIIPFFKFKNTKLFDMDCDIRFNPLNMFPNHQKISLIHLNTRYVFRLSDLCKLWKDALLHSYGVKPDPILPVNPFIRKEFTMQHLYAIYFKLRETSFKIPLCIQGFFKYSFDIEKFKYRCYSLLKDNAIDTYFYTKSSVTSKLYDIVNMLRYRKDFIGDTYISENSNWETKTQIVEKMEKYLIMHLYATESCNPIKRNLYEDKCNKGLIAFFKENPSFCRREILWPRNRRRETILWSLNIPPITHTLLPRRGNIIEEINDLENNSTSLLLPENLRDSIDQILNTPLRTQPSDILDEVERIIDQSMEIDDIDDESREIDYPEEEEGEEEEELIPTVTVDLNNITNDI